MDSVFHLRLTITTNVVDWSIDFDTTISDYLDTFKNMYLWNGTDTEAYY